MGVFKKKEKNKNLIVLDIGTQFIKALLLEIDKNSQKGIVRAWTKESFANDKATACQKAIKKIKNKSGIKTEEVFVGLGSNVLRGKTATFCFKREDQLQKIDLSELKYLIQKIQWRALDNIRKEFAQETEFSETEVKLIDSFVVDIKIDGHSISDPIGFSGHNICLSVFNTYTSGKWLDDIKSFISGLDLKLMGIASTAYALFNCLDLEKSPKGSALVVDIGSKITEVTMIKDGGEAIEIKNFYLGGQAFSRVLAEFLGSNLEQAERLKAKYSRSEVSKEAKRKIEKLFAANISSWMKGMKIVLNDFAREHKLLPGKIFLCGEGSKLPLIESELKKEKEFKINYIFPRDVLKIENKTRLEEMPILALAGLYLDLSKEKEAFSSILKRAVKLIQE